LHGVTRGNGYIGEGVTQNIKTIQSIPLRLRIPEKKEVLGFTKKHSISKNIIKYINKQTGRMEIRGEVYVKKKEFDQLNKERKKQGKDMFANPRNIAAGSIRQLDSKIAAKRPLDFLAWRLETEMGQIDQVQGMEILKLWGFKTHEGIAVNKIKDIKKHYNVAKDEREKLNYWVDGVVIRVNNLATYNSLGVVGKTPRGLVAWKFPAEEVTTKVKTIKYLVGRTGSLTPVASFDPVWVGGTTVQNASLHNIDELERLDIRVGDTVIIYKAGDIIPKVKQVLLELREKGSEKVKLPNKCPVCLSDVIRKSNEVNIYCKNRDCFAKNRERLVHIVKAFDIEGLGPQTASALIENQIIKKPSDIFKIEASQLLSLEGFAELSAKKLIDEIQSKKTIQFNKFIVALSIPNVGNENAMLLAKKFHKLSLLQSAGIDELGLIEGVGPIMAKGIHAYFTDEYNLDLISEYLKNGVIIELNKKSQKKQILDGIKFALTGSLENFSRVEVGEKIHELGGSIVSSVSRNTDFVLAGQNPGSKYSKAVELKVKTLSEKEFLHMIGSNTLNIQLWDY
jgi:DNA ligase (NAD+)